MASEVYLCSKRSIIKFAPWFNHIYIVTNGQIPIWLNTNQPDISVIPHSKIFRDQKDLPTFQSNAIEVNLHRIPGLADNFIYFNDDMALIGPLCPEDLLLANGSYARFPTSEVTCYKKKGLFLILLN